MFIFTVNQNISNFNLDRKENRIICLLRLLYGSQAIFSRVGWELFSVEGLVLEARGSVFVDVDQCQVVSVTDYK